MAKKTIEELDFKLILDDKDLNEKVAKANKETKKLNQSLSQYLTVKKAQGNLSQQEYLTLKRIDNLETNRRINADKEAVSAQRRVAAEERVAKAKQGSNRQQERHNKLLREAATLAGSYLSIWGAEKLITNIVRITAEFEKQKIALEAILQDTEGADAIYEQIKQLAVKSPFNFKELTTYAKQLSAYSIPMNELYDTTKMLADVSAGLGVGMDRLVLAYGQIRSAAFLRGTEVRQLTEAGIPIIAELQKQIKELEGNAISAAQVFDRISTRQISFEMVEKAFKDMTSEGGKFYEMQEVLAETLGGKISNLTDAFQIMFSEIGNKNSGLLNGAVDAILSLAENYEKVGHILADLIITYGTYKAALLVVNLVERATIQAHLGHIATSKALAGTIAMLTKKTKAYALAQKLLGGLKNPYVALAVGASALIVTLLRYAKSLDDGTQGIKNFNAYLDEQNKQLEENKKKVSESLEVARNTEKSYNERINAIKKILAVYPELIRYYKDEADALADIANLNEKVKIAELDRRYSSDLNRLVELLEIRRRIEDAIKANEGTAGSQAIPAMRQQVKELQAEIDALKAEMATYDEVFQNGPFPDEGKETLEGWRKAIADILKEAQGMKLNVGLSFNPKNIDTTTLDDAIKEVQSRIEEVQNSRKNAIGIENADIIKTYDLQLDYLEKINKVLKGRATPTTKGGSNANPYADEIKALNEQAREVNRLIDAYRKLQEIGMGNDAINAWLTAEWGRPVNGLKALEDEIRRIATELLSFGEEGAAQSLLDGISKDITSLFVEAAKAYQSVTKEVQKYLAEDFNILGKGYAAEISRIIAKLNTDNGLVGINADKMKGDLYKGLQSAYEYAKESDSEVSKQRFAELLSQHEYQCKLIDEAADREIAANKKVAETSIAQKAKSIVEDLYSKNEGGAIITTGLGKRTLTELRAYASAMKGMVGNLGLENIKEQADKAGISVDALLDAIEKIINADIRNNEYQQFKILKKRAEQASQAVSGLGAELSNLGGTIDNELLTNFGHILDVVGEISDTIIDAVDSMEGLSDAGNELAEEGENIAKSADWITMIVKLALIAVREIGVALGNNAARTEAVTEATIKLRDTLYEIAEASNKTIFGDNYFGSMALSIREAQNALDDFLGSTGGLMLKNNFEKKFPDIVNSSIWKELTGGKAGIDIKGIVSSGDIAQIKKLLALMQEIQDAEGFDKGFKNEAKESISLLEDYVKRVEDFESQVADMFNNLASTITDTMIQAFKETGNAVQDLTGLFEDMGESIVKTAIQSYLIDNILNGYKEKITEAMGSYSTSQKTKQDMEYFIKSLSTIFNEMKEGLEGAGDVINEVLRQANLSRLMNEDDDTLANGIKGITEDTANLLASYVNAIRADVAYGRAQRDEIIQHLEAMAGFSAPNLTDYLNAIQANTYDIAQTNQKMLSHLESMMTTSDGPALRVFM
jgi:hypothetical protein